MYRYTYIGFPKERNVKVRECDEIYYSVIGYHGENSFIYVETPVENLDVESYVSGDFKPFPTGKSLFRMEQIFYCDDFKNDEILCIPREERQPVMSIMILDHDAPMLAYFAHHYLLQEDGKTVWNRYYSIYEFSNILISVSDEADIPVNERESKFDVDIMPIVEDTKPIINQNKLCEWGKING